MAPNYNENNIRLESNFLLTDRYEVSKYVTKYSTGVPLIFFVHESILPNFVFLRFPIFAAKLCHYIVNNFFSYVTNTQAYQQKMEKFCISEEKSLVGSTPGVSPNLILLEKSI